MNSPWTFKYSFVPDKSMVMKAYGDGIQYGLVLFGLPIRGIDSGFVSFDPNAKPFKNLIW